MLYKAPLFSSLLLQTQEFFFLSNKLLKTALQFDTINFVHNAKLHIALTILTGKKSPYVLLFQHNIPRRSWSRGESVRKS